MEQVTMERDDKVTQKSCILIGGSSDAILKDMLQRIQSLRKLDKKKIQMVIVTGSRDRAFLLCSSFCKALQHTPILCHASVGSLKFERDLKALHYGVDILIVTAGRLSRLYYGNENCFDRIHSILLDQCELLFSRPILKRTMESMSLLPEQDITAFTTTGTPIAKNCCSIESIQEALMSLHYSVNQITYLPPIQQPLTEPNNRIPGFYSVLPECDSLSVVKRIPYILASIRYMIQSKIPLVSAVTSSEYKINLLLSMLLENRINGVHILCLSESNIHKEIRSRYQFLREVVNHNTRETPITQVILLIHDCWLPYLRNCALLDVMIHMDLPLSEEIFLSRISLLRSSSDSNSLYFVTSSQLGVLQLLHTKYECPLGPYPSDIPVTEAKQFVERYLRKHGDSESLDIEKIPLEDLTEEEKHELFYQNAKAEVVLSDLVEREEINLKDIDMSGLEECMNIMDDTQHENPAQIISTPLQTSTMDSSLINSIFNPFLNPLVHSFSQPQSSLMFSIF